MDCAALVIVESPAKAKTIKRYLGSDYSVEASVGHIRDIIQPKNVKLDKRYDLTIHEDNSNFIVTALMYLEKALQKISGNRGTLSVKMVKKRLPNYVKR